jgi:N-acetylglucosaminyl-diphospho-decaprenol L-rhamnosyltransferase
LDRFTTGPAMKEQRDTDAPSGSDANPVTVVVVTFNARQHLHAMLSSLEAEAQDRSVTIIVVDNGSTDGTVEYLQDQAPVRLIEQSNTGFAHGVNRGITAAPDGDDILVLNPDVVLMPGALARLRSCLADETDVGIAVPRLVDEHGVTLPSLRRDPSIRGTLVEALVGGSRAKRFGEACVPRRLDQGQDVDWATGAVLLIRRDVVDQIGHLDESFFLYSEETDYCRRARNAGWRIRCEPRASAHHVGGDLARNPQLWALRAVNRVRLYRRYAGPMRTFAFRLVSVLFEARRAITGDRGSRRALRALLTFDLEEMAASLIVALAGELPAEQKALQ